jgi:hypothetical protein
MTTAGEPRSTSKSGKVLCAMQDALSEKRRPLDHECGGNSIYFSVVSAGW